MNAIALKTNLIALQAGLRETTRRAAKEAVEEEREVTDNILGVDVVLKYEGTHGRGTTVVYSGVFLNGERWGTETERHPWSVFEEISTWYSVGDLLLKHQAEAIIKRAQVTDVEITEEEYPAENGPLRYYFIAASLRSVVKLWKTIQKTNLDEL